jgi:lysophospholipase L1-like esterase
MKSSSVGLRLFVCGVAALLFSTSLVKAQDTGPTPYPDPKNESAWPGVGPIRFFPDWMPGNRKGFWAAREKDQGKIVFVGDSIIAGWKLDKDFPGKSIANRGIGGDTSRGLLFRFQEDVLDLHPKAVVIEIGANDITADAQVAQTIANYNALLDMAQKANPDMPIIILALLPQAIPTGDKAPKGGLLAYLTKVQARIPQVNAELAKIPATRKNVTFVDTNAVLLTPEGTQDTKLFTPDGVHPTDAGHTKAAEPVVKALDDLKLQ